MSTTLLVPLDGSPLGERALAYAEGLAAGQEARLVLTRSAQAHSFPGRDPSDEQVRAIEAAESYLQQVAAGLRERGITVETAVPYGPAAQGILDEIKIRAPDLVVMATHGRSGLGRWLYGSVAEAVLGHSPVPVLLVRAWQQAQPARLSEGPQRLLVPLDGSAFAEAALPVALDLAARLKGELMLVQAVLPPNFPPTPDGAVFATLDVDLDALEASAQGYLLQVRERLLSERPDLQVQVDVRVGSIAGSLVTASIEHQVTLVVMATHGRTGLSRALLGSVAGALLREGGTPLVLVRPRALPPVPTVLAPPKEADVEPEPSVTVTMTPGDVDLIRMALQTLSQSVSRHEHLHDRIHRLLERLSDKESKEAATAG